MLAEQKTEFTTLLATAVAVYGKTITTGMVDLYFAALQQHDLAVVRDGLSRHLQDPVAGQYMPKPADIIRQIQASHHDGRPEGDEAWSMAAVASDESVTTVLTDEIQGALWVAKPLIEMGDMIAARKAFLDAYARLVRVAREQGKQAKWHVSLGQSQQGRAVAIEDAVRLGRITQEAGSKHLLQLGHDSAPVTADGQAIAGLITGNAPRGPVSPGVREQLAKLRASLVNRSAESTAQRKERERAEYAELCARTDRLLGIGDGVAPDCADAPDKHAPATVARGDA
jgi:hypothetical protein